MAKIVLKIRNNTIIIFIYQYDKLKDITFLVIYFNRTSGEFNVYYYGILNATLVIINVTVYFYWYVNYLKKKTNICNVGTLIFIIQYKSSKILQKVFLMDVNTFLLLFTEKRRKRRKTARSRTFFLKTKLNFILQMYII